MKLFGRFEAVKFVEENKIFITNDGYLYYIYNPEYNNWRKYYNAGNDRITVKNYGEVSREDLVDALNGIFPEKETDFMRFCPPGQLCIRDMMDLYQEDYPDIMEEYEIVHCVHRLLLESNNCEHSYLRIKEIFDDKNRLNNAELLKQVKELCFNIIGRDIFKEEIGIVDGHNSSSYFWIMPVKILDSSDTGSIDNVAEMRSSEISIEEDDVAQYLTPFLDKYFDDNLSANMNRVDYEWENEEGTIERSTISGFEWYLTYNFYTYESINSILSDIRDTIAAFTDGIDTDYTKKICEKAYRFDKDLVIDFYQRFIYRMEYMVHVGAEKGYDLISFMGP